MNTNIKELYSEILFFQEEICFWYDSRFYDIKELMDGGYMVEVFTNDENGFSEDTDDLRWVNGGEYGDRQPDDAIEFALEL